MLPFIEQTAREAGKYLLHYFGKIRPDQIRNKEGAHNLVTEIDEGCERLIIKAIESRYPDHQIIGEESPRKQTDSDFQWLIDPIDGTNNFVHFMPYFSISIGLSYKGEMKYGVVYQPYYNEMFKAEKDKGAFLNNEPIHVSACDTFSKSLLVTGFAALRQDPNSINKKIFTDFAGQVDGMRRLGSAAIDLCYTAMGRMDGFWEFGLSPYDVAAGGLIVKEAGGVVTDIHGKNNWLFGDSIVAAGKSFHPILISKLGTYFK